MVVHKTRQFLFFLGGGVIFLNFLCFIIEWSQNCFQLFFKQILLELIQQPQKLYVDKQEWEANAL